MFGASPHSAKRRRTRQPAEQHALAAEEVAEPPGDEQEGAEGDQVAVEHPRQLGLADPEVALDHGERDVHDRDVDHDHHLDRQDGREGGGLAVLLEESF